MGGQDLNLKKSWHPGRAVQIAATQRAEADAIAERRKIRERQAEIEAARKQEEVQRQLEAAGGARKPDRVEWMYSGPVDGQAGAESLEGYLLGKRRIDKILMGDDKEKLEKQMGAEDTSLVAAPGVNSLRDTASKIREDPLVAIKKQEMLAYEQIMNDPVRRKQLFRSMGIEDPRKPAKRMEEKRHKHRHYHRHWRHGEDDLDEDRRSFTRRKRSYSGSRSPREDCRDKIRDRRTSRRESSGQKRSRSASALERESVSTRQDYRRDPTETRPPLPPSRRSASRERIIRRRDDSPRRRNNRDKYSIRDGARDNKNGSPCRHDWDFPDRPRYTNAHTKNSGYNSRRDDFLTKKPHDGAEERARKIAAMQEAACDLDLARERRLAALEASERAAREADSKEREQSRKYGGGDRHFANKMHRKTQVMNLSDRLGRDRKGLQRDDDGD